MKNIQSIIILIMLLMFWCTNVVASNLIEIKKDFTNLFWTEVVNKLEKQIESTPTERLKEIKRILFIEHMAKILEEDYSYRNTIIINYLYFTIRDTIDIRELSYIGLTEDEAYTLAKKRGDQVRSMYLDNPGAILTDDYVPWRITFEIKDWKVVSYRIEL